MSATVIECVPNISEGRSAALIDRIADSVVGVPLLNRSSDPDHNRTVFTFAGNPEAVLFAALSLADAAFERLSISAHTGVHPRIGVLDVLPFVPVVDSSIAECAAIAHRAAHEIWKRWSVPSFYYEAAGSEPLESVRRRAGAGASPDVGSHRHPTAGAVAVGARKFLIAWNIWLDSVCLDTAQRIAKAIRASSGGLPGVKALGLPLRSRNLVQVSINSTDFEATPLHVVLQAVEQLAAAYNVTVLGCELIGLLPQRALDLSADRDLRWLNWSPNLVLERALQ